MTTTEAHCATCRCYSTTQQTLDRREAVNGVLDRWIDTELEFGMPGRIYRRHLWRQLEAWAKGEGIEVPSGTALYARLRTLGHREVKVRGRYYFEGITVRGGIIDMRAAATLDPPTAEAAADET